MRHSVFLTSFFIAAAYCNQGFAQESEPVLANVEYNFIYVNDLNHPDLPIKEEMVLRLGKTVSKYTSLTNENNMKKAAQRTQTMITGPAITVTGGPLAVVNGPGLTTDELFQSPQNSKLIKTATLGLENYLIETALPKIDWKIENVTKVIGSYTCQKATGAYAGRTYTAWFTPDLPFQNGPWKLSGLPGLIMEAEDSRNEVMFIFKDISKDPGDERTSSSRKRLIKVSEAAFEKARKAFNENPAAVVRSQLPANAPEVHIAYHDASGTTVTGDEAKLILDKQRKEDPGKKINPLELIVP